MRDDASGCSYWAATAPPGPRWPALRESCRVDECGVFASPHAAREDGRVDLAFHRVGIQPLDGVTEFDELLVVLAQFVQVRGGVAGVGDVDRAGSFEVTVDGVPADR